MPPATGKRARVYCSKRCKTRAYNARHRGATRVDPPAYERGRWSRCKHGHAIRKKSQRVFIGTYFEQCKRCYTRRRGSERKSREGYCRNDLHLMDGANVGYRGDTDTRYCKACHRNQQHQSRRVRIKELGYRDTKCPVRGCNSSVERSPRNPLPYYCPRHRKQAPLWVRAAMGERAA